MQSTVSIFAGGYFSHHASSNIKIVFPDATGAGSAQHLVEVLRGHGYPDLSAGNQDGGESHIGGSDPMPARIADIANLKISTDETLVVPEDVSTSMKDVLSPVDRSIVKYFFGTIPVKVDGCAGKYDPAPSSHVSSAGDFYQVAYPIEIPDHGTKPPTAMVFVSDW